MKIDCDFVSVLGKAKESNEDIHWKMILIIVLYKLCKNEIDMAIDRRESNEVLV